MAWWRSGKGYDRARLLESAARARRRGRRQKAIALYRQVLEHEPHNADLHRRIAPLLAETRQPEAAFASYRCAAEALVRKGFVDHAAGVFREAVGRLPRRREVWEALADLEIAREKPADAHRVLFEGHRQFRAKRHRSEAVLLLMRARRLAPRDFTTSFALARLLAKTGARGRALKLLDEMASWATGRQLRRVRARQLRLAPGLGPLWRWVRALFGRR
jgi:tetratricopeptide (TPR) repeat protein